MKRTELRAGDKSLERGSTFKQRLGAQFTRAAKPKARSVSPASAAQRAKVRETPSIISGGWGCDAAHLWPRGRQGCDSPLCVVPLTRLEHNAFDHGSLDLLPYLLQAGMVAEMQHALGHAEGNLPALLLRLTGERWIPASSARRPA